MTELELTIACRPCDRVWPIIQGQVGIEGCNVRFFPIDPEEAFARAFGDQDFDITELSTSSHILATARGETHYVGLPVFTMRTFRHSAFYIRTDRGIARQDRGRPRISDDGGAVGFPAGPRNRCLPRLSR
jgi:4,5-dihydroxyphthalate decarboxylase